MDRAVRTVDAAKVPVPSTVPEERTITALESPQEFYHRLVQRPDIQELMERLAKH